MKSKFTKFLTLGLIILSTFSCRKDDDLTTNENLQEIETVEVIGNITINGDIPF